MKTFLSFSQHLNLLYYKQNNHTNHFLCNKIDKLSATKNDSHIILEKSIDDIVKEVSSVLYNAACLGDKDKRISKNKKAKRKIKKPYYDKECENKYRILKAKSRQLCNEPWNKTLCLKVLQNKKRT